MELKSLTYTSRSSPDLRQADLDSILQSARTNNALQGLSGVLIFDGTHFLQILEGVAPAIDELLVRLRADRRHSNLLIRDTRWIERRTFGSWSMAYVLLDDGRLIGGTEIERVLQHDIPDSLRDMISGLTRHAPPPPGNRPAA